MAMTKDKIKKNYLNLLVLCVCKVSILAAKRRKERRNGKMFV